ncbi:MAG TPA: thiamine-phosphate kinase [Blastocatellia bacterium]|nr:thiamine-phosphate kinase [Blastocatellia bacterium]
MKSEFAFINQLRARAARRADNLICGIGDDTAILGQRAGRETLITADLLIEDVHFKPAYTPFQCLGHKSLAVSLSDIAAMGGVPRYALLTLGIPKSLSDDGQWEEFFAGYFALAEEFNVTLIGGDTCAAPDRLTIDSIVLGECDEGKALRRNGARTGDAIYLTGEIGASAAGLELLRRGERLSQGSRAAGQNALRAHLMPQPRVKFGRLVGASGLAHAMVDVSDGLAQDLAHICEESGVGAIIDFESVLVAAETRLVRESDDAAFALAISGGEDYELLLTADRDDEAALLEMARQCNLPLTRIGEVTDADPATGFAPLLRRAGRIEPVTVRGYDHFA